MKQALLALMFGFLLASHVVIAQDSTRALNKNAVYLELGGNGTILSLNYERIFYQKDNLRLCARIGSGIITGALFNWHEMFDFSFPLAEVNLLSGKSKNFFETGFGFTYDTRSVYEYTYTPPTGYTEYEFNHYYIFYRLGYRYQSKKGFMFRSAATPVFYFRPLYRNGSWKRAGLLRVFPWIGLSAGYSF